MEHKGLNLALASTVLATGLNAATPKTLEDALVNLPDAGSNRVEKTAQEVSDILDEKYPELKDNGNIDFNDLNVYGVSKRINDETYAGMGMKYENDNLNVVLEKGAKHQQGSIVYKKDIPNTNFHVKAGLGIMETEMDILGQQKDVKQTNAGLAAGYSDEKTYGIELGHTIYKLDGAANADGYARKTFVEGIYKHDLSDTSSVEATGVIKNTKVFGTNYTDYSAGLNIYPTNDLKVGAVYDSFDHDKNDYKAMAGIKINLDNGEISPLFTLAANTNKNVSAILEYSQNIRKKPISMRDEFENGVSTTSVVAQETAPEIFSEKTTKQTETNETTETTVATPTLTFNAAPGADDLLSISETATTITFEVDTPSSGGDDGTAQVTVNVTNGGIVEVNGVDYTNGQKFNVSDPVYGGANQSGTIKLKKSDGTVVWTKTFTGT